MNKFAAAFILFAFSMQFMIAGEKRVYVSNEMGGTVSVIDMAADTIISTVPVGKRPRGIHLSPDGKSVYVALSGSPVAGPLSETHFPSGLRWMPRADKSADGIGVIDVAQNKLARTLTGGSDPEQFSLSLDGSKLYISNEDAATASVVDAKSGEVLQTISVDAEPEGVTTTRDGKFFYVTCEGDATVVKIDVETCKPVASIRVSPRPRSIAFLPDGSKAYVACETSSAICVLDVAKNKMTTTIKPAPVVPPAEAQGNDTIRPMGIAVAPDGKRIFVTTGHAGVVLVLDTATDEIAGFIRVGKRPWGIAITADGKKLYVANGLSDDISVVDTAAQKVVKTIQVPADSRPWGIAIGP